MSVDARGKFGGVLVFGNWKGRPTIRKLVTPANPRSASQTAQRAMVGFLGPAWAPMTALQKAGWDELAAQGNYSGFNAFTSYNLARWTQFTWPIITPGQAAGTAPVMGTLTATGGVGVINVSQVITTANGIWGMAIAVSATTGFTPAKADVNYIARYSASPVTAVLTRFDPGTYFVRTLGFNIGGTANSWVAEDEVTVT